MARANVANTLVVPTESTVLPFYDDYNEEKNFHRLLFRPGYAVQARELTQLQTILQNQIERFGRHIFENGSSVIGGDVLVPDNSYATLKLDTEYAGSTIDVSAFLNQVVTLSDGSSNVLFRCVHVDAETSEDPPTLYGTYITPSLFNDSQTIRVQGSSTYANTTSDHAALSRLAFLRDSIFFYSGYFVKVPTQATVISKYSTEANCRIGLEMEDEIVTENTDSSLLDPAQEAFNYQAPGAARYKLELNLTTRSLDSEDDTKFIELARVEGGKLRKLVEYPLYSEIEEVLARRTYDESGNYTVRPFVLNFTADRFDPDYYYAAKLSPGKAYVFGYEHQTIADTELRVPKARTKANVTGYDLNMNYGNYVITSNVRGVFDTSTFQLFDIHCVDHANVAIANSTVYTSTKIGTGKIRDLNFFSGDTVVDDRKYEFYLFDTQWSSKNTNVSTANTTHVTLYDPGSTLKFTSQNNAYTNATIKITDVSTSVVYTYQVNTYNATTRTIGLPPGQTFGATLVNSDQVSLEFDFSDAESFIINANFTANATSNAQAMISPLNKSAGSNTGDVFVFEPTLTSLIFPLAQKYIANNLTNMAYTYRRKFSSITFTNGVSSSMVSGTTPAEQFVGATSSSNISSTVMDNFIVIVTNPLTSARYTGEVVKVTSSVTGAPEAAVLNSSNTSETFTATVFAKMEYATGLIPKTKTLYTKSIDVLSSDTPTMIVGPTGSTANVYLPTGHVTISNPSKRVGVAESLYICDVQAVTVFDLNGAAIPSSGADIYSYTDVTSKYELNSGQKDTHYDHAFIKLKPGVIPPIGPLIVVCRYYAHSSIPSSGGGFFVVDSYSNLSTGIYENGTYLGDGYSIIPSYTTTSGDVLELRDCIDFRPTRDNGIGLTPNYTLSNGRVPIPTTDFAIDYQYYLGRKDLIVLNANKTFSLVEGSPAKQPFEPTVPAKSMVLYTLNVPPYTEYYSDIGVKYIDNKRYTMRDIGKIDKRVENLEYYVTLNTLEKAAIDINITDVDGLNRTKHGIFVDSFTGHSLGDSTRDDYRCAMNFSLGYMQNQAITTGFPLEANTTLSSGVTFTRDKAVLQYTTTKYLEQPYATKYAPISEYLYAVFEGNIITSPEADIWKSTSVAPDIILTDTNTNEYTTVGVYESVVDSQVRR